MRNRAKYNLDLQKWHKNGGLMQSKEKLFLKELPKTEFWKGDIVHTKSAERLVVIKVIYEHYPLIYYEVYDPSENNFPFIFVKEEELELIERGKIWKICYDEPIEFASLIEEVNFFIEIGRYKYVRNENGFYHWTTKEAIEAIQQGKADGFMIETDPTINLELLGHQKNFQLIKILPKNLSKEFWEDTLKKLPNLEKRLKYLPLGTVKR